MCALVCVLVMCSCSPEKQEIKFGGVSVQNWQEDTIRVAAKMIDID
ncbi:hypothetical protein EZS27_010050 [termite gut metagenome]|uniref:Uncharacterized protein n=1 Tax=termite gut metagenome TaxID=433724 RepID=A0A5J4S7T7_9ZZZZ